MKPVSFSALRTLVKPIVPLAWRTPGQQGVTVIFDPNLKPTHLIQEGASQPPPSSASVPKALRLTIPDYEQHFYKVKPRNSSGAPSGSFFEVDINSPRRVSPLFDRKIPTPQNHLLRTLMRPIDPKTGSVLDTHPGLHLKAWLRNAFSGQPAQEGFLQQYPTIKLLDTLEALNQGYNPQIQAVSDHLYWIFHGRNPGKNIEFAQVAANLSPPAESSFNAIWQRALKTVEDTWYPIRRSS